MSYDLKITGGTIVDGSGKPGFVGDLGIKDGKVVALGKADGPAATTIDAKGKVVSPGFVDVHTHYDAQILWDRMLSISPWHGVTTTVIGNCGFGVAPTRAAHRKLIMQTLEKVEGMSLEALEAGLGTDWPFETFPQYLDALEKRGAAINIAALFGHTPLRLYVMGEESTERAATAEELVGLLVGLYGEGLAHIVAALYQDLCHLSIRLKMEFGLKREPPQARRCIRWSLAKIAAAAAKVSIDQAIDKELSRLRPGSFVVI